MLLSILIIFSVALIAPLIDKVLKQWTGIILSVIPLFLILYFIFYATEAFQGGVIQTAVRWVEVLDLNISFYLDGLSALFTVLILGIGFFILIYSNGYMKKEKLTGRFYSYMLIFMGSMLGLVLSGSLISLYIFWELTSVSSFLLISLHHQKEKSRAAGLQALLVTSFGGLAMLAAFILIGNIQGTYELSELLQQSIEISNPLFVPVVILMLLGAFTKSAQFPFHFWLPSAMAAPTPVSAYLHSAAMVNAGIYLVARMNPFMGDTEIWQITIITFGMATMFVGAYFSLTQKDLKRILAYSTISALGILMLLLGINTTLSIKAALLYLLVHALYKATLFMVAGIIDHKTGTRNIYKLGGLGKLMPITTMVALLALASKASLPPMMGYISKKLIFKTNIKYLDSEPFLIVLGFVSFVFLFAVSVLIAYQVFFNKQSSYEKKPSEGGFSMLFGPLVFAILSFIMGIFPEHSEKYIEFAAEVIKAKNVEVDFKLWSGFTNVFWLSIGSIVGGIVFFIFRSRILPFFQWLNAWLFHLELSNIFMAFIGKLLDLTKKFTGFVQHGYHRFYLFIVFAVGGVILWFTILLINFRFSGINSSPLTIPITGVIIIASAAALITVFTKSKLTAIIAMGAVGFSMAIFFLINGAIDLAITFIIVDTLTLVLFVMVSLKLPEFIKFSSKQTRIRDGIVALFIGGAMFFIALITSLSENPGTISDYYLQKSVPEGLGKNVVNVILVDFRAMDTFGEIIVLLLAALSIFALLKLKPGER